MALEVSGKKLQVIKASAGSGKTYQLAKIYIQNMLGAVVKRGAKFRYKLHGNDDYYRHILAITFTNKATAEMKRRIIDELYALSVQNDEGNTVESSYYDDFKVEFVDSIDDVVERAGRALRVLLFGYSAFNVSTIDAFFQTVLRSFARELDRDAGYDLQLDSDYAVNVAVHSFLQNLGTPYVDKNVERWTCDLIKRRLDNDKKWDLFDGNGILQKFAKNINSELFRQKHDEVREYLLDVGVKAPGKKSRVNRFLQLLSDLRNEQKRLFEEAHENFVTAVNSVPGFNRDTDLKKGWMIGKFLGWENVEDDFKKIFGDKKTVADITVGNLEKSVIKGSQEKFSSSVHDELCKCALGMVEANTSWKSLSELWHNVGLFGLLGEIDKQLTIYRKDSNSILISDTNELVSQTLKGGVPFVYERIGSWINNFMIDEFQDTSQMQYDNFKPLLENAMSGGEGENSLVIGDEKQSIYRFRNANPDLLQSKLEEDFRSSCRVDHLDTSYRSCKAIVEFNNGLFAPDRLLRTLGDVAGMATKITETYANVVQKAKSENEGYVCINLPKEKTKDDKVDYHAKVLELLPNYILDILKRGFKPKDVLILVNSNSEGVEIVNCILSYNETAGNDEKLPITSGEALLLKNSPSVRLIVSVLRYIDSTLYQKVNPGDDEKLAAMLHKHQREMRQYRVLRSFESQLAEGGDDGKADFGNVLAACFDNEPFDDGNSESSDEFVDQIKDFLPDGANELGTMVNLVDRIVSKFFSTAADKQETMFIMAFQDFVLDFCNQHTGGTVREFLQCWEQKSGSLSVNSAADDDAVKVLTIHKSKGLEAPCVIVPFAKWNMVKMDETWVDKDNLMSLLKPKCKDDKQKAELEELTPPLMPVSLTTLQNEPEFAELYEEQRGDDLIDNINKTYVAFTRPKQELHIFAQNGKTESGSKGISGVCAMLEKALTADDDFANMFSAKEGKWEYGRCYEFGKATGKIEPANGDVETAIGVAMPVYEVHSSGASAVKVRLPDSSAAQTFGTRMHAVLARMRSASDLDYALRFGVSKGFLTDAEESEWRGLLIEALKKETVAEWFDANNRAVYNERSVAFDYHDERDCARPDRVVLRPDGTVVIVDYKFGEDRSKAEEYKDQVKGYMNMWREAHKAQAVKGYVWYVRLGEIVEVE